MFGKKGKTQGSEQTMKKEPKKIMGYTLEEIIGNIITFACLVLPLTCGALGWAGYADSHPEIMWRMEIVALTFSWLGIIIAVLPGYGQFKKEMAAKNRLAIPRFIIGTSINVFAFVFVIAITIYGLSNATEVNGVHHVGGNQATEYLNYFATSYTAVVIVKVLFAWAL